MTGLKSNVIPDLQEAKGLVEIVLADGRKRMANLLSICNAIDILDRIKDDVPPSHSMEWTILWKRSWYLARKQRM